MNMPQQAHTQTQTHATRAAAAAGSGSSAAAAAAVAAAAAAERKKTKTVISSNEKQSKPCGERTHPSGASTAPKALSVAHSMSHNALASMTSNLRPPKYTRMPLSNKTIAHWRSVLAERCEHEAMLATIGSGANQPFFECELGEVDVEMGVQAWIASPQHHKFHCVIEMGSDQQRYSQIPHKRLIPARLKWVSSTCMLPTCMCLHRALRIPLRS